MKIAVTIARVLFGLIFFVFGLNGFLHFLPVPGPTSAEGGEFMGGLAGTGYIFPIVKLIETLVGLALLSGFMVPLALVVIFPIVVVIALYHTITEPAGAGMAVVLLALNLFLAYYNRASYAALLQVTNAWKS